MKIDVFSKYVSHLIERIEIAISIFPDRRYPTASTLYFNDRSRRAALRRVMIRVSNLDGAPRETAHAAERPRGVKRGPIEAVQAASRLIIVPMPHPRA